MSEAQETKLLADGQYAAFEDMTWPMPNPDLEWQLRYGEPTRTKMLIAASIVSAYQELVTCTEAKRRNIIRRLRAAAAEARRDG